MELAQQPGAGTPTSGAAPAGAGAAASAAGAQAGQATGAGSPDPFDWTKVPPAAYEQASPQVFQRLGWVPMGRFREVLKKKNELETRVSSAGGAAPAKDPLDEILGGGEDQGLTKEDLNFELGMRDANAFLAQKNIRGGSDELDQIKQFLSDNGLDNSPYPDRVVKLAYNAIFGGKEEDAGKDLKKQGAPSGAGSFGRGAAPASGGGQKFTRKLLAEMEKQPNYMQWYLQNKAAIYDQIGKEGPLPAE